MRDKGNMVSEVLIWISMFIFYIVLLLIISIDVTGYNETKVDNIMLYTGDDMQLRFNVTNHTETPATYYWELACLLNSSLVSKCEVTRSLDDGETYVRDDEFCKLEFSAPECEDFEDNMTYRIRWRVEGDKDDDNIRITYLNENDTRDYFWSEDFSFEDEFILYCPEYEECERDDFEQINITDDQFKAYCLEPFGEYGSQVTALNEWWGERFKSLQEDLGSYRQSNDNLAIDLSECKEELATCNSIVEDCQTCYDQQRECDDMSANLQAARDKGSLYGTILVVLVAIIVVLVFGQLIHRAVKKHLYDIYDRGE